MGYAILVVAAILTLDYLLTYRKKSSKRPLNSKQKAMMSKA